VSKRRPAPGFHRDGTAQRGLFYLRFVLLFFTARAVHAVDLPNLLRAAQYSAAHQGKAFLVLEHGKPIYQNFPNGGSAQEARKIYSGTKGFWIFAALAAEEEGILRLDERVAETIGAWRGDPRKESITIRDLLDFTSGLEPVFHLHSDEVPDRNAVAIATPLVAPRGERFIYGPAALQVFEELLRRKLLARHDTPAHFLERHILAPLGLGPQTYKTDRAGNPLLASGFRMTAEQWSRLGRVMLHGGTPLIRPPSFAQCCQGTTTNPAFGLGFWNNHEAGPNAREFDIEDMLERDWLKQDWRGACICRDAPADLIAAVGSGYQRLFVIPSLDLIIVRLGAGGRFSDPEFLRLALGR
jgi:CubicO group peptidase (beta-lactamase class C family)